MPSMPHAPSFGYAVSRPLPYKWFSWVVFIGGIISIVLFSIINFAANGYDPLVVFRPDPNSTVAQTIWTERRPFSWFNKLSTECQAQNLPVNSQIYTNKLSLPHTITGVFQNHTGVEVALPSLQYMNNNLTDCAINQMIFDLESSSRNANQQTTLPWGIEASAYSTCYVQNGGARTWINLTTKFDYVQSTVTSNPGYRGTNFLDLNEQNKTALWWGQSLLGWYYLDLAQYLEWNKNNNHTTDAGGNALVKATFRNEPRWWDATDLTDLYYFHNVIKTVYTQGDDDIRGGADNTGGTNTGPNPSYLSEWPQIFPKADQYAKILYSVILADLGNSKRPNILTDSILLQNYSRPLTDRSPDIYNPYNLYTGPAYSGFDPESKSNGPLTIDNSTIYAEYFCQVPRRKSAGALIVAIVVADIVFLRTVWNILNFSTKSWLEHSDPQSKYCEGCLMLMRDGFELDPTPPTDDPSTDARLRMHGRQISTDSREPLYSSQLQPNDDA